MRYCVEQTGTIAREGEIDFGAMILFAMKQVGMLSMPVLAAVLVMAVLSNLAQTGLIFTGEQLKPNINKLNPMKKFKQWFSIKSMQDLAKNLAKILAAFIVGALAWKAAIPKIIESVVSTPEQLIATAGSIVSGMFWKILILYIVVAAADYFFQRKNFTTEHKMTDKEVRDEYKNTEGDPYQKAKRRQMAQEIAMNQSQEQAQYSDVVVINPTELAIGIKYDPDVSPVPYVVAMGATRVADDIRYAAREHNIPVVRNKPLARALFEMCQIGDIVPEDLYKPVAEVLAYVFALKEQGSDAKAAATAAPVDPAIAQQWVGTTQQPLAAQQTATQPTVHELPEIVVPAMTPAGQSAEAAGRWPPANPQSVSPQPVSPQSVSPQPASPQTGGQFAWSGGTISTAPAGWLASPDPAVPIADLPIYNTTNSSYPGNTAPGSPQPRRAVTPPQETP
jgi:flagellar biosynthetic protein FlhB